MKKTPHTTVHTHMQSSSCNSHKEKKEANRKQRDFLKIVCCETALIQLFSTEWKGRDGCAWTWTDGKEYEVTPDLARLMGFFMGNGTAETLPVSFYHLKDADFHKLVFYESILKKTFKETEWYILPPSLLGFRYLVPFTFEDKKQFVLNWQKLMFSGDGDNKVVPSIILNSPEDIKRAFLQGLYDSAGAAGSQIQTVYTLIKSLGYVVADANKPKVRRKKGKQKRRM